MNKQEIFDKVVERLRDGKGRCIREGSCLYYDRKTGNRCAVGYVLPLEIAKEIDDYSTSVELLPERFEVPAWVKEHMVLLSDLQTVHDNYINWEDNKFIAEETLKQLARENDLVYK